MQTHSREIKAAILHRIASGLSPIGSTLPSCRGLAAELHVNRNTAHKAYADLVRQGIIEVVRGKGYRVVKLPENGGASVPDTVNHRLLAAARDAKLMGIDRASFVRMATDVADRLYVRNAPLIAAIDCNDHDARSFAEELSAALSEPVESCLLTDVEQAPDEVASKYDIICVPLYHLAQVKRLMPSADGKIMPVHLPPDSPALVELAGLQPGSRVGGVCDMPVTRTFLAAAISAVFEGDVHVCLASNRETLQKLVRSVDVLVDVPSCHQEISKLFPSVRTLTVGFHLDPNSLFNLRLKLAKVRSQQAINVTDEMTVRTDAKPSRTPHYAAA
jgi:DNA-binding transcriptional regulator YhcF (GntR family)